MIICGLGHYLTKYQDGCIAVYSGYQTKSPQLLRKSCLSDRRKILVQVIIQVQIPARVLCTSRIQKFFVVMSFSLCVCMYFLLPSKMPKSSKSRLYLSQLKISDASIIFPTWVFSRLSFTILNFPLPTCWICARNTWLECSTIHHASTSSLCPCLLLNKMLRP